MTMFSTTLFRDRKDAGEKLAARLLSEGIAYDLVLAIPRGGLPLGEIIARKLSLPLDVVLTKKIGARFNKEYAIGALSLKGRILEPQASDSDPGYIESETRRIRKLLEERDAKYHQRAKRHELKGKKVILVDDGIATGSTMLATVDLIHNEGALKITLAIPVAPPSAIERLVSSPHVDHVVCLQQPKQFYAIGQFYENFGQVSDEEAVSILENTGAME